jgi:hypothetical protein
MSENTKGSSGEAFPPKRFPERHGAALPTAVVVKGLLTPGIITFISSVFVFMGLTWLMVIGT